MAGARERFCSPASVITAVVSALLLAPAVDAEARADPPEPRVSVGVSALSRHLPFGLRGPDGALISSFVTVQRGRFAASIATMQYTRPAGDLPGMGFAGAGLDVRYGISRGERVSASIGYQLATAPAFGIGETQAITATLGVAGEAWSTSVEALGDFRAGSGLLVIGTARRRIGPLEGLVAAGYNHRYFYDGSGPTFATIGASWRHRVGATTLEPSISYTAPLAPTSGSGLVLGLTATVELRGPSR